MSEFNKESLKQFFIEELPNIALFVVKQDEYRFMNKNESTESILLQHLI